MREIEHKYLSEGKDIYVVGNEDELMQIAKLALRPESFIPKEGPNVVVLNIFDFIR